MIDKNKLEALSYEELSAMLQELIGAFQRGNMKLSEAVEKYNLCVELLSLCQTRLDKLSGVLEESDKLDINSVDIDFEKNMDALEHMIAKLNRDENVSVLELQEMSSQSKKLLQECDHALSSFQNVIEYKV